jgi:nitrate reductase gamma subunit
MDYLIYVILPYITIIVFVGGLIWRFRTWWAKPRAKAVLFPVASNKYVAAGRVVGDIVIFGKTFSISKFLWAAALIFHFGLLLVVLGHIRTITEIGFLWSWFNLDEEGISDVAHAMGMTAGVIMLTGAVLLTVRRFTPNMRVISLFRDYLVLFGLLAIVVTGISMRLWAPIHAEEIQHYARGVLTFSPAVEISNGIFFWHFFLAQLTVMYLPFSKLVHLVSKPVAESWTMR